MTFLVYIANGLVMPPAMFFMGGFYKLKGKEINFKSLPISISIITITTLITSLQFIFPGIIKALDRNREALLSGELWRLITPLFIQPMGIWQCVFNGIFFLAFLPIAEFIYRRKLILIYFTAGLVGQIFNYYWVGQSYPKIMQKWMPFFIAFKNYIALKMRVIVLHIKLRG